MTDSLESDLSAAQHPVRRGTTASPSPDSLALDSPAPDSPAPACGGCGRTPRAGEPVTAAGVPWTWSTAHDDANGEGVSVLCEGCAREHARSIEAKLDAEWW